MGVLNSEHGVSSSEHGVPSEHGCAQQKNIYKLNIDTDQLALLFQVLRLHKVNSLFF